MEHVDINSSISDENKVMDCFIIMDDISGSAGSCKELAGFLTATQKYRYVSVFHIIIRDKDIWKKNYFTNEYF